VPTIILTRSAEDNARTGRELAARGHATVSVPMIELRPIEQSAERLASLRPSVRDATVLLTSAHATKVWLVMRYEHFDAAAPASYLVVGASSAAMLAERDPDVPVLAVVGSARELSTVASLVRRVIYPCSRVRRDEALEIFADRGVEVLQLPLYEPVMPEGAGDHLARALEESTPPRVILFFSPSAVANWFSLRSDIPPDSIFLAIGPTTTESLRARGVERITTVGGSDGETLAGAIARSLARGS
jgi:uroporphyrinogen-III synthase